MLALLLSLLTVSVSGYIRLVESGLGCEDWPNCYGQYNYNESAQGVNVLMHKGEQSSHRIARVAHRLVTSVLGGIILFIFVTAMRRSEFGLGKIAPASLLIATIILASIGSIHPVQPLPILRQANFLGGLFLVSISFYLFLRVRISPVDKIKTKLYPLVRLGLLVIVTQIILGGWASANYAAVSCESLFECHSSEHQNVVVAGGLLSVKPLQLDENKQVIIDSRMQTFQFVHHVLAVSALLYFIFLTMVLIRSERKLKNNGIAILALMIVQCLLGLIALDFQLPLVIIVLHNFLSALLIIATISLNVKTISRVSL